MFWKTIRWVGTFLAIGLTVGAIMVSLDSAPKPAQPGAAAPSMQSQPPIRQGGKNFNF